MPSQPWISVVGSSTSTVLNGQLRVLSDFPGQPSGLPWGVKFLNGDHFIAAGNVDCKNNKSRRSSHSDILLSADIPVIEFASSGIWSCHQTSARSCVQGSPSSTSPSIFQTSSAEPGRFLFHWRVIFAIQRSLLWSLLFPQFRGSAPALIRNPASIDAQNQ